MNIVVCHRRMDCLNRSFYGGQPVLSVVGMGSISINLDLIDRVNNKTQPANESTKEATSAERPYTMVSKEDDDNIDTEYNKV